MLSSTYKLYSYQKLYQNLVEVPYKPLPSNIYVREFLTLNYCKHESKLAAEDNNTLTVFIFATKQMFLDNPYHRSKYGPLQLA